MTNDDTTKATASIQRLVEFYNSRIEKHGYSYSAMWGDENSSKSSERFQPLLQLPIQNGDVLVDIGCGIGDLAAFLKNNGRYVRYVGIEAVPAFAKFCREVQGVEVLEFDAFEKPNEIPDVDWIVSFGTLNKTWNIGVQPGNDHVGRIEAIISELYKRARKGVAITCVTDLVQYTKPEVANCNPGRMIDFLSKIGSHFLCFHGYDFYEFFVASWRSHRR